MILLPIVHLCSFYFLLATFSDNPWLGFLERVFVFFKEVLNDILILITPLWHNLPGRGEAGGGDNSPRLSRSFSLSLSTRHFILLFSRTPPYP